MPRVRDISFIRKLCGLGLLPQTLAQCLLPELRKLIPAHSAGVFWVDSRGEMTSLYAERLLPPDAMAAYYAKHYAVAREGFAEAFGSRARNADPVSVRSFSQAEQDTEYFRDVMHRLDAYHILYAVLKEAGRPFAQLSFYRGAGDKAFDSRSADTLRSILRYAEAGLGSRAATGKLDDVAAVVEEDLGVVTLDGVILSASDTWRRLLRLAALAEVSPRTAAHEQETIDRFTRRACQELLDANQNALSTSESVHATTWGRFVVRAFRLTDAAGRRADHVALLIRREEPRALSLVRGTGRASLSPQQREVALLIAAGKSNREIADDLGLSFNTASSHVKQVYTRLDVNERAEVATKLLTLAQLAAAH